MTLDRDIQEEYDERFSEEDKKHLIEGEVYPKQANKYLQKPGMLNKLLELIGVKHEKRFSGGEISEFVKKSIPPEQVIRYHERFDYLTITFLNNLKCPPEKANRYAKIFKDGWGIVDLIRDGITFKQAKKYGRKFLAMEVNDLVRNGVPPEKANRYNARFTALDIIELIKANCSPKEADQYNKRFQGFGIAILYRIGLKPGKISLTQQDNLRVLLGKLIYYNEIKLNSKEFSLLGTGSSGVVLLKKDNAWKFSQQIRQEYESLKAIQERSNGNQKNILGLKGEPQGDIALETEYIPGDTLEEILVQQQSLPSDKVFKYASGILNGLIEMRTAEIMHHRDIKPKNIIINEKTDEPVIIDLGVATTKRWPTQEAEYNKAYGTHDLVALAQVMYKMAIGEHLFSESETMEVTKVKYDIRDEREAVYHNEQGEVEGNERLSEKLQPYFQKVDQKVADERVRTLVKHCLIAKPYHFRKTQRLFKRLAA
ncbi:protein kinase [Candidatus Woesearchaeota archaeon]|nr:protein kinase [Candidatus Woesearchaeota archaeon]